MPDFCEAGWEPLAIYMIGPDLEDFEHVFKIFKAGYFKSPRAVLNYNLVRAGKNGVGIDQIAGSRIQGTKKWECCGSHQMSMPA